MHNLGYRNAIRPRISLVSRSTTTLSAKAPDVMRQVLGKMGKHTLSAS